MDNTVVVFNKNIIVFDHNIQFKKNNAKGIKYQSYEQRSKYYTKHLFQPQELK